MTDPIWINILICIENLVVKISIIMELLISHYAPIRNFPILLSDFTTEIDHFSE